jgi:hypothetical protein
MRRGLQKSNIACATGAHFGQITAERAQSGHEGLQFRKLVIASTPDPVCL